MIDSTARAISMCFVVALLSLPAHSEDAVEVAYSSGLVSLPSSHETVTLRITRRGLPLDSGQELSETDNYFAKVSALLENHEILENWELGMLDAANIRINIDIAGRKWKLISSHLTVEQPGYLLLTESGLQRVTNGDFDSLLAKQSKSYRYHRIAFEEILRLSLEHSSALSFPSKVENAN